MMTRARCFVVAQKGLAVGMVDSVYFTAVILLIIVFFCYHSWLALKTLFAKHPSKDHPSAVAVNESDKA